MIILALDALDLELVRRFHCTNLIQAECGQTDISDFKEPRTIVLWASFLSGKNMEARIPLETQWEFTLDVQDTFLKLFNQYKTIDVPSFSYKQPNHAEERKLLKGYFDDKTTVEEFDALVWRYNKENRKEFLDAVGKFDLLMGYFDLADAIGHLSFGVADKMKTVYEELEDLAEKIKGSDDFILVISDHGMKAVGRYGDHTKRGFYSVNHKLGSHLPKITDFYDIVRSKA